MKNQIKARCHKASGFLVFLLLCSTAHADLTEWKYKLIQEGKEVKCTQMIGNKCLSWNWREKDDRIFERISVWYGQNEDRFLGFESDENGLIKIPLASCENTPGEIYKWEPIDNGQPDKPKVWLQALPEGDNIGAQIEKSPKISCNIKVVEAGTYYLWIRGEGDDASSDSINYGIDGVRLGAITFFNQPWSKDRQNHDEDAMVVLKEGSQLLDIWPREPGTKIAIAVLTKDVNYIPTDESVIAP